VLAAVAMFFSSFSTPFLTGALTIGVWLVGRSAGEMASIESSVLPEPVRDLLHGIAWVVPNFHLFVPPRRTLIDTVEGVGGPAQYVAEAMTYGALYAAGLIVLACVVFRRRDFL
jgi:Cu-processing system permease protein